MPLRVLFFGTPAFAVPTLEALLASPDATVVGVVTQPDKPRGRGQQVSASPVKARAESAGLPVLQPTRLGSGDFLDAVRAFEPDLGVVAAYGRLLPEAVLALPRLGLINVHASLLPRWRGASPIERAIMEGDARDRRHHHARGQGARRRRDDRGGAHADRARRDRRGARSAALRDRRVAARVDAAGDRRRHGATRRRRTRRW